MKILILVLSFDQFPYDKLHQAQQDTWDSINVPGIDTVYYYGSHIKGTLQSGTVAELWHDTPCSDEYFMMHRKFKLCLDKVNYKDYDFIFRTNSSSYVNKEKLIEFAKTLPKEKCYAGWDLGPKRSISGAGIWLSPDLTDILKEEIPEWEQIEEDLLIGRILVDKYGIETIDDKSRYDVPFRWEESQINKEAYHIRFKTGDRARDVENMYRIHKILSQ